MNAIKLISTLSFLFIFSLSFGQTKKFNPEKGMISMNVLEANYTIKVGEMVYYSGSVHGSVGSTFAVKIKDGTVLKQTKKHFAYNKPIVDGETGGDAGVSTYVFKALKEGKTTITVTEGFRGETTETYVIKIKVVKK